MRVGLRQGLGPALEQDLAALAPTLRAEVNHVVGLLDDVHVVLDDHHRVALVDEPVQDVEEMTHVLEVHAGGRLVENVERVAGAGAGELLRELHALRLPAAERGGRLAEGEVAEPHRVERLEGADEARLVLEEIDRLRHGHVQHLGDVLTLILHLQRLGPVALAIARVAGHVHVR